MIEAFPELVAAAGVGTRKSPPPRATDFPLEGGERAALLELGALALMRRAGATAIAATPIPAAPPETRRISDTAEAVEEALSDSMPAALEWAREAARRGFVAPPSVVSRLVPLAAKQREFRPVLGERGRWLAGIMGVEVREPEAALPAKDEWDSLGPDDRMSLVMDSPEDEALFVKALGDRRKEVRTAAFDRLSQMPGSALARELRQRALAAVVVRKGLLKTTLEVVPPDLESLPKAIPQEAAYGLGPVAVALHGLVAHVPPSLWGLAPERMLELAARTEYAEALRLGWARAALRFEDQAWRDAIFRAAFGQSLYAWTEAVARGVSESAFDAEIVARLRAGGPPSAEAVRVIHWRDAPMSPALSREVVRTARAAASHYGFEPFGPRLDLSVLPLLDEPWPEGSAEALRLRWRKLLDLRRRLLESLR